jgi:hypothetical protein
MPNWVYTTIIVEGGDKEKLKEIGEKGLARYYKPMPQELENTTSPVRVGENMSQEKYNELVVKYGHADWYSWCNANWDTKWGCCNSDLSDDTLTFETAWSPLSPELIEMFKEDFPNFRYEWEEEQGFGAIMEYSDGDLIVLEEWDIPNTEYHYVEESGEEIIELKEDHKKAEKGFYSEYYFETLLGNTLEEAINTLKTN